MSSIKKVVIAAAGQGTRMHQLSKNKSKHLINISKRPFLAYLLDNLFEAGYQEVALVVGYREDLMKKFVEDYRFSGKKQRIELVSQYEILGPKEKEYGTACPLKCMKGIIKEPFVFLYGDNLYSVKDLQAMQVNDDYHYVAGMENNHPEKYGVLIEENGFLREIIEKPKQFVGNLINTGPFKFTPAVFDKIAQIKKSPRGEYEITDVISLLAKDKRVKIKKIQDFWIDFGNPGDVIRLSHFIKNGNSKAVVQSA